MPESHTTDQPIVPRGRVKEQQLRHDIENTTKVKQPTLSSPARVDCKTRNDTKYCKTEQGLNNISP